MPAILCLWLAAAVSWWEPVRLRVAQHPAFFFAAWWILIGGISFAIFRGRRGPRPEMAWRRLRKASLLTAAVLVVLFLITLPLPEISGHPPLTIIPIALALPALVVLSTIAAWLAGKELGLRG